MGLKIFKAGMQIAFGKSLYRLYNLPALTAEQVVRQRSNLKLYRVLTVSV
jgi:hypothetical protein